MDALRHSKAIPLAIAFLLGAVWQFFLTKLFLLIGGYLDVDLMQRIFQWHLLTRDHFHLLYRPMQAVLWTVLIGLICGVPLGLIARRDTLLCWVVFALTALASSGVLLWIHGSSVSIFMGLWSIPEAWLYLLGVLLFALPTSALLNRSVPLQPNKRWKGPL